MWMIRVKVAMLAVVAGAFWSVQLSPAQAPPTPVPPGTPVTISVTPAAASAPGVSITLGPRHGHVVPHRQGCTHTGGGNIDIAQPSPDTVVVTMTGVAVAYGAFWSSSAALQFDLEQCLEINFDNPKLKKAKLTLEARVIGLLRSGCKEGAAEYQNACAALSVGPAKVLALCVPPHSVAAGENLSVNDHDGPVSVPITAGKYTLHQSFQIDAIAARGLLPKGPSAEFAPDPALDPLWISYHEPFHGAAKKDFGFQVTLKVAEDTETTSGEDEKKASEKIPKEPRKLKNGE